MSRIDEALRRAAEEAADTEADAPVPAPEPASDRDVSVLAREPFPVELATTARTSQRREQGQDREEEPAEPRPASQSEPLFERIAGRLAGKIVTDNNMSPLSREQYRRLAAVLHDAQATAGTRVVMMASAVAGEGKTLTASNLALTLSESYRKNVLLIDADLRKPTLHEVFMINSAVGLTEGLNPASDTKLVVHQVSPRLAVLPAGRPTTDPMASLISDRMRQLIEEAKDSFDWVIIDTPPVVLLPDANLLAAMADAAVLVIRANSTPHALVKRAVDAIGAQRILGTVLNQTTSVALPGYGAYYYGNYYVTPTQTLKRT
jgi:capsular exopolysaccharide synthesis family protein